MIYTISVDDLLTKKNLSIPEYQRPYKWTGKNISELLEDINHAADGSVEYYIGTIILHKDKNKFDIVDGQQRLISLLLIRYYLDEADFKCSLLDKAFSNKISQRNIYENNMFIRDWFSMKKQCRDKILKAFKNILKAVVIEVNQVNEAFQLFDSQNTRGKALAPHDLLKAYHLRAMRSRPYEMQRSVTKWEAVSEKDIRELFDLYLYPVLNWSRSQKTTSFTANEIDAYKGISENSDYTYAKRVGHAMPYFQMTEPFVEGQCFFEMVEYYLELLEDIKNEINTNKSFEGLSEILQSKDNCKSTGFNYVKNLFICALMCYYDKFHNFEEQAVKKMFKWAMMLRVDLEHLGFDSINKYAVGEDNDRYTNNIQLFFIIKNARVHSEISNLQIKVYRKNGSAQADQWNDLYNDILNLNDRGDSSDEN